MIRALELPQQGADFLPREHYRQPLRPAGGNDPRQLQDFLLEEEQSAPSNILRGRGDVALHGQAGKVIPDLRRTQPRRVAIAIEADVILNVMQVASFRAEAEAAYADHAARFLQKLTNGIDLWRHGTWQKLNVGQSTL